MTGDFQNFIGGLDVERAPLMTLPPMQVGDSEEPRVDAVATPEGVGSTIRTMGAP